MNINYVLYIAFTLSLSIYLIVMKFFLTLLFLAAVTTAFGQQAVVAERPFACADDEYGIPLSAARPTLIDGHDYGWETWGEGCIFDGWLTTIWRDDEGVRVNPYEYKMRCEFQRSTTPEGYVRIVEPWRSKTGWFGQFDDVAEGRDLIIDMTDPRLVIIMPQATGIVAVHPVSKTPIEYIVHNYEGYSFFFKDDADGVVDINSKHPDLATTIQDGVIHIQAPMWSVINLGAEISDDDLGGCNAPEATIWLPGSEGVLSVTVDNDSVAEYYNLQGMKVDNPAHGCYIRLQGKRVEKIFIR